ncbi:unnamed protein product [Didymodactylos carnosus]|uniref:Uncharacterized protein n=1 Tax=Didymodactylos carnosus TaxID=1234261 RepID=A0A815JSC4_9BILA|nr:unnamed protein product [Didymodactylos carnosus]CAF4281024.1 unnamed protein product [Didymodactylos carnosus]
MRVKVKILSVLLLSIDPLENLKTGDSYQQFYEIWVFLDVADNTTERVKSAVDENTANLVGLRTACPDDLKNSDVFELEDEITLIEASKLFVRGAVSGATCDFKTKCATKHCSCKKAGVACSTKCHSKRGACENTK